MGVRGRSDPRDRRGAAHADVAAAGGRPRPARGHHVGRLRPVLHGSHSVPGPLDAGARRRDAPPPSDRDLRVQPDNARAVRTASHQGWGPFLLDLSLALAPHRLRGRALARQPACAARGGGVVVRSGGRVVSLR